MKTLDYKTLNNVQGGTILGTLTEKVLLEPVGEYWKKTCQGYFDDWNAKRSVKTVSTLALLSLAVIASSLTNGS